MKRMLTAIVFLSLPRDDTGVGNIAVRVSNVAKSPEDQRLKLVIYYKLSLYQVSVFAFPCPL